MISDQVDSEITLWSKRLALVLVGWFASSAYHGVFDLKQKETTLQQVQQVEIPKLKSQAHCEGKRADKAEAVAGQAILSANIDAVPTPQFKDLPADNCPHPAGK